MILTVKVDAGMEFAQEVKEILGMRIEPLGVCRVIRIEDDGYGVQIGIGGQGERIATPSVRTGFAMTGEPEAGRNAGRQSLPQSPAKAGASSLVRGSQGAAAQGTTPQSAQLTAPLTQGSLRTGQETRAETEIPGLGGPYDDTLRYCYELMERRKKEAARNG